MNDKPQTDAEIAKFNFEFMAMMQMAGRNKEAQVAADKVAAALKRLVEKEKAQ